MAQVRKLGTQIVFSVTNAIALINKDSVMKLKIQKTPKRNSLVFMIELEDVFSGTGVSIAELPDIIGGFDLTDMCSYAKCVVQHQVEVEALLAEQGVTLTVYEDFEELEASMV